MPVIFSIARDGRILSALCCRRAGPPPLLGALLLADTTLCAASRPSTRVPPETDLLRVSPESPAEGMTSSEGVTSRRQGVWLGDVKGELGSYWWPQYPRGRVSGNLA